MMTEEQVREKIVTLEKQRQAFVDQANQQVAAMNGAIQALKELLEPVKEQPDEVTRN